MNQNLSAPLFLAETPIIWCLQKDNFLYCYNRVHPAVRHYLLVWESIPNILIHLNFTMNYSLWKCCIALSRVWANVVNMSQPTVWDAWALSGPCSAFRSIQMKHKWHRCQFSETNWMYLTDSIDVTSVCIMSESVQVVRITTHMLKCTHMYIWNNFYIWNYCSGHDVKNWIFPGIYYLVGL